MQRLPCHLEDEGDQRNVIERIHHGEQKLSPVRTESAGEYRTDIGFKHNDRNKADQAENEDSDILFQRFEANPVFLYEAGNDETNDLSQITVSVIHHLYRVDNRFSLGIQVNRIGFDGNVQNAKPGKNEAAQQEQVLFFRMITEIVKQNGDGHKAERGKDEGV